MTTSPSVKHLPSPSWTLIGLEMAAARTCARREKRRNGVVSDRTLKRLSEVMAKANAALLVDDILEASKGTS